MATQTIPVQSMQSNIHQRSFGCYPNLVQSPNKQNTPTEKDESIEYEMTAKPLRYNELIKSKFPLGMHKIGNLYQCNFWAPESNITMKDFVEAHSIPVYELKNKSNFSKYCNDKEWFNSAAKFNRIWNSVHTSNGRLICGIKSKFDVSIQVSDCFVAGNGSIMRAYGIIGGDQMSVARAFSYLSDTWRPDFFRDIRWHHDSIFYCDSAFPNNKCLRKTDPCGNILGNIQLDSVFSNDDINNANTDKKREFNTNCLIITLPKNHRFNPKIIRQYQMQYEIKNTSRFQAIIIKSSTPSELNEFKQIIRRHLKNDYILSEKLVRI